MSMPERQPRNLGELEQRASQIITPHAWDFISGGAQDEVTLRRNRSAFESVMLRTRFMRDVSSRDLSTTVLGERISLPVMLAPIGRHQMVHPEGELATARAAGSSGTILVVATGSSVSIEDISREATGPLWFQLYHISRDVTQMLVRRAEQSGYRALCICVDIPVPSPLERAMRHGWKYPPGFPHANFVGDVAGMGIAEGSQEALFWYPPPTIPFTWSDLSWVRTITSLPIVLKGLRTPEDASQAADCGVEGIIVSNHGGRQLDGAPASIEMLPAIVDAVNGRAEIYLDSGIRRGSDVIKALSLGARAVLVGRPLLWGLAWDGEDGVRLVLDILRDETDLVLGHCGHTTVETLDRSVVSLPHGFAGCTCRLP